MNEVNGGVQPNYRKLSIDCPKYSGGGGITLLFINQRHPICTHLLYLFAEM